MRKLTYKYLPTLLQKATKDVTGPMCLTCLKPVDSEELVEGYEMDSQGREGQYPYCKVLVKCHGAEELVRFEFDTTAWDDRDLKQVMSRTRFFNPLGEGEGAGFSAVAK